MRQVQKKLTDPTFQHCTSVHLVCDNCLGIHSLLQLHVYKHNNLYHSSLRKHFIEGAGAKKNMLETFVCLTMNKADEGFL